MGEEKGCVCTECCLACTYKPGWFAPGEAERVAEFLKISMKELFDQYLMVDWWSDYPHDIFNLSPAIIGHSGGTAPGRPTGCCIFFKEDRCSIHEVKPMECRLGFGCSKDVFTESNSVHKKVADTWRNKKAQKQIVSLLGREPEAENYSLLDLLDDL